MKELLNLPPLVLKTRHLGRQWYGYRFGLGLLVENKPTDFSCMSCGLCFSANIHVLCCRSKLLCREVQYRRLYWLLISVFIYGTIWLVIFMGYYLLFTWLTMVSLSRTRLSSTSIVQNQLLVQEIPEIRLGSIIIIMPCTFNNM